jgi:peptidoglycan/LPS O-acetylase OafA/YrhL
MSASSSEFSPHAPIPSLTGIRAVAALCVVVSHGFTFIPPFPGGSPAWYPELVSLSAIGMSVFFVLSGFVIHYNYSHSIAADRLRGLWNFFVARFARLYPLYIACILLTLTYKGVLDNFLAGNAAAKSMISHALPFFLTLTQSWFYNIHDGHSLVYQLPYLTITLSWSVSTEWFFYLAYPLMLVAVLRLKSIWKLVAAGAIVSMAALATLNFVYRESDRIDHYGLHHFGLLADPATGGYQDSLIRWIVYFSPYSRIAEFAIGVLTAAAFMHVAAKEPSTLEKRIGTALTYFAVLIIAVEHAVMFYPTTPAPFLTFLHQSFGFAPPAALLLFCLARYRQTAISKALSSTWALACGDASYSIYLLQFVGLGDLAYDFTGLSSNYWGHMLVMSIRIATGILATVGLAIVMHAIYERPARRLLRRWLSVPSKMPAMANTTT